MNSKSIVFGAAIECQAVACVFVVCAAMMCFFCWPAAIPLLLTAAGIFAWVHFRALTVTADTEGITYQNPRRPLHVHFSWSQFTCLYRLVGVTRTLYLFSPSPLTQDELRTLVRKHNRLRCPVPEVDGCLVVNYGRSNTELDALIPPHIRRVPYQECISL